MFTFIFLYGGDVKDIVSRKEYSDACKSFSLKGFRVINPADLKHTANDDIKRISAVVYWNSSTRSKLFKNIPPDKLA